MCRRFIYYEMDQNRIWQDNILLCYVNILIKKEIINMITFFKFYYIDL